jgi:hypothetical protein
MLNKNRRLTGLAPLALACATFGNTAHAQNYAPWLTQIGLNSAISSAASWGKDQVIGVVDTGISMTSRQFAAGQISAAQSACAAVTFRCSNGVNDDNGHGTSVASIAAGNTLWGSTNSYGGYTTVANSFIGVAPNANIVAEKVLNAAGSGYSSDVANGIIRAANSGATVINLSLTFMNSADIANAVNYATGKGAFIVWAGGNSAANLLSGGATAGWNQNAINHLVFAGSVNSASQLSSFSNKPGTGAFVATTGGATSYANRWVMAPGENIIAPAVQYGSSTYMYWSGTSMAAPVVSGSLALLQSAWPILRTQGSAANLLLATATDLGTRGVDASYGSGMVNLSTAFQPYGTLSITAANGKAYAVPSITGTLISSGAFGTLATIKSKLATYTAFDGYTRNFTVNLSGLIASPAGKATLNPLPVNTNTGPTKVKLTDGGEFAFSMEALPPAAAGLDSATGMASQSQPEGRRNGYMMFTDRAGTTTAMGYGAPVHYAFGMSLYGDEGMARASDALAVSGLSPLARGGAMFAWGGRLDDDTRVAFSYSGATPTSAFNPMQFVQAWSGADASTVSMGLARRIGQDFTAGVTLSSLEERHGLLGGTYDPNSLMSLGSRNRSTAVGLSGALRLSADTLLMAESQWSSTRDSDGGGLISGVTGVRARAAGLSLTSRNVWRDDDRLTFSARQPMRVVAGQAGVITSSVDAQGLPVQRTEWTSVVPDGREMDYRLAYDVSTGRDKTLAVQFTVKRDYLNIAGNHDAAAGLVWRAKF